MKGPKLLCSQERPPLQGQGIRAGLTLRGTSRRIGARQGPEPARALPRQRHKPWGFKADHTRSPHGPGADLMPPPAGSQPRRTPTPRAPLSRGGPVSSLSVGNGAPSHPRCIERQPKPPRLEQRHQRAAPRRPRRVEHQSAAGHTEQSKPCAPCSQTTALTRHSAARALAHPTRHCRKLRTHKSINRQRDHCRLILSPGGGSRRRVLLLQSRNALSFLITGRSSRGCSPRRPAGCRATRSTGP